MPLPPSFLRDGFTEYKPTRRRLMLKTEGEPDTGKTEFALSAPGPGIMLPLDRGFDPVYDNPNPPPTRRNDFAIKIVTVPAAGTKEKEDYQKYWINYRTELYKAIDNPDCNTVVIDGDNDSWELQRLGHFGKLTQVPPIMYTEANAARRALVSRCWDSGKIIIATNKLKDEYVETELEDGTVELDDKGRPKTHRSGRRVAQGHSDNGFLWQLGILHLYKPGTTIERGPRAGTVLPGQWGLRIIKCKSRPDLVGTELWGSDCNFQGLVQCVYPQVELSEWGYK